MNIVATYQDYLEQTEESKADFVYTTVSKYKSSKDYRAACDGDNYANGRNTLIEQYQKVLYTVTGRAVPDTISPNYKLKTGFFKRFVRQRAAYLLSNGIRFEDKSTKEKFGNDFDHELYFNGYDTLAQGVVYGFYNKDHIEFFTAKEFVPLFDEETGELRGGIRFWQIADNKPQRATLYDDNGVTEYIKRADESKPVILRQNPYKSIVRAAPADGITINDGGSYGSFPIVPWYANRAKQSELVGIKEQIDSYDLIKSGFANDMDEANQILWILHNLGGMDDDVSLAKFVERIKTVKAAVVDSDQQIESRTVEPPFEARQTYLTLLRKDLYEDAMALDTQEIAAGNVTATQITAAYEALSQAADDFEAQTIKFILGLLKVMGITDYPKFDRSQVSNAPETTQMIMSTETVLDNETLVDKLPFLTTDEKEVVKERLSAEQMNMANMGMNNGRRT